MSEENLTNQEENLEPENQYEELSKGDAMAGVFTAPGETYETIANTPKKNYWFISILVSVLVGLIVTFLFMRDAELVSQTMDKKKQEVRKQMEEKVKAGKMTREEANMAIEQTEKFMNSDSVFFKAIGFGGAIVGPFLILFILAIIYLIILKIMKAQFDFTNVLNVVGLAMLIYAVGSVIGMVVSILKGEMSSIGLGLILSEQSVGEKVYGLISKLDVFSIWFYAVIGIGLSRIAKIETTKAIVVAFIPFVLYIIITFVFA